MVSINHFLLIYDRDKDVLVENKNFGENQEEAIAAYHSAEKEHWDNPRMDIVLVGSDSIETVKITHSNYFEGSVRRNIDAVLNAKFRVA